MAAIGRNLWSVFSTQAQARADNRTQRLIQPTRVNDTSALPPATQYEGRMFWVSGTVKALYVSDGTNWKKVTVT